MGIFDSLLGRSSSRLNPQSLSSEAGIGSRAYRQDFTSMAQQPAVRDDRSAGVGDVDISQQELANSRFYGTSHHRADQMTELHRDVMQKTGSSNVMEQTVDKLNARVKINGRVFGNITFFEMRKMVADAIQKEAPASPDAEARAWGQWLSEPSRLTALMMPEINSEMCRRDMKLDKDAKGDLSDGEQVESTDNVENVEKIDRDKKRIYVGDRKRMDNLSNFINSGQTRDVDGEPYTIYWIQESYKTDVARDKGQDDYHTWTPEMKAIHEKSMNIPSNDAMECYEQLEKANRKKYFLSNSEKAIKNSRDFKNMVMTKTINWFKTTIQNRFFRLTSLYGIDFFKSRGNTIQFARDVGQQDYDRGSVNRVITDSEWAHANRMGYTGAGGHIRRVNGQDRFKLKQ